MKFDIGSLVSVRGREWVVLPESNNDPNMLILRPLGGSEDEITGIYWPIESVESSTFDLPDPRKDLGNHLSCKLLRDAVRLGFRSGAGPFRSLARIGVEPRPYQIVPLLMALKLDPVRILIADDVGVGKTVEACLIARELWDRGEIQGLSVLCPPHLAEQWQKSLDEQFHIPTKLVLSGTASKLERTCRQDESLFKKYPFTVVSTDYIKSDRHRGEFLRSCPELVIVDEAHTCTTNVSRNSGQKRHELLKDLTNPKDENGEFRHIILVTATPHSGKQETFHSLLSILDRQFIDFPNDLTGDVNRSKREILAKHFVQRRRGDLKSYLDTVTPFPIREKAEKHYVLAPEYRKFFDRVLSYCRESVRRTDIEVRHQRVRWWSALALLRSLSSSPMAAIDTLRNRSSVSLKETREEIDEEGRRTVLDIDVESTEGIDVVPGSETGEDPENERKRLLALAREAKNLLGNKDTKLMGLVEIVKQFLKDRYSPIIFCRFISTVDYVSEFLKNEFGKQGVHVEGITGMLTPEIRENRVMVLGNSDKRVLVCTDCLSEGINLQHTFDAVIHYDLSWNPTRHEQREGRVDRYNQPKDKVRTLTYYGKDNPVDGIVLEVLLRKHQEIQKQLGVIVPLPMDTKVIEDAIYEGLLLREHIDPLQLTFDFLAPFHKEVGIEWEKAVELEKKSQTIFAQSQLLNAINNQVRDELEEVKQAIGDNSVVMDFTKLSLKSFGAIVEGDDPIKVSLGETPKAIQHALGENKYIEATFFQQPGPKVQKLTRTHPIVEGLASLTLESSFDTLVSSPAGRCGVIRTDEVKRRTVLFLIRLRFNIESDGRDGRKQQLLAEDIMLESFSGSPNSTAWLSQKESESLLNLKPSENIDPDQAEIHLSQVLDQFDLIKPLLNEKAEERGKQLYDSHRRVRTATKRGIRSLKVNLHKPVDILGLYIYLPAINGE